MKLIFVYNSNSGFFSAVSDSLHKTFSPKTYQCNLCALTFGALSMKKEWEEFIEKLKIDVEFLHKDELIKKYGLKDDELPAAFLKKGEKLKKVITKTEMNKCRTVSALKHLVAMKLKKF